jgi:hypothetical protein
LLNISKKKKKKIIIIIIRFVDKVQTPGSQALLLLTIFNIEIMIDRSLLNSSKERNL